MSSSAGGDERGPRDLLTTPGPRSAPCAWRILTTSLLLCLYQKRNDALLSRCISVVPSCVV